MLPPWLELALNEWDVTEASGSANNPIVQGYITDATGATLPDSTNWCACFVTSMLKRAGLVIPTLPNGAYPTTFRSYGTALPGPKVGAIAIKSGATHVGFVLAARGASFLLLGGNQDSAGGSSPAVTAIERQVSFFEGFRWPPGA